MLGDNDEVLSGTTSSAADTFESFVRAAARDGTDDAPVVIGDSMDEKTREIVRFFLNHKDWTSEILQPRETYGVVIKVEGDNPTQVSYVGGNGLAIGFFYHPDQPRYRNNQGQRFKVGDIIKNVFLEPGLIPDEVTIIDMPPVQKRLFIEAISANHAEVLESLKRHMKQ